VLSRVIWFAISAIFAQLTPRVRADLRGRVPGVVVEDGHRGRPGRHRIAIISTERLKAGVELRWRILGVATLGSVLALLAALTFVERRVQHAAKRADSNAAASPLPLLIEQWSEVSEQLQKE
jgi:hypothetical protein